MFTNLVFHFIILEKPEREKGTFYSCYSFNHSLIRLQEIVKIIILKSHHAMQRTYSKIFKNFRNFKLKIKILKIIVKTFNFSIDIFSSKIFKYYFMHVNRRFSFALKIKLSEFKIFKFHKTTLRCLILTLNLALTMLNLAQIKV